MKEKTCKITLFLGGGDRQTYREAILTDSLLPELTFTAPDEFGALKKFITTVPFLIEHELNEESNVC